MIESNDFGGVTPAHKPLATPNIVAGTKLRILGNLTTIFQLPTLNP
jgi:hypothetical protein